MSRTQQKLADAKGDIKHEFLETEGFVSTIGESGSNELNFYNSNDFSLMQRLELS